MEGKNVIYFYRDWWDFLEDFNIQQRGEWITYVMKYVNDLDPDYPTDKQVMSCCKIIQNQLDRDLEEWKKTIEKRSEAGKKGMASRWGNKENITSDNNVITNDNTVITMNNDKDKVKDKEKDKDKVIDKDKDIDTILSKEIEEGNIKTLQQLIELVEMNIYNKPISNADAKILKNICNEFSFDSVYRDLENYKNDGIKQPITYYKKALENAEIQEKVFKKVDDGGNNNTPPTTQTYEFNDYMSAFKVYTDEDAPQHIRDKAKEFLDGKRGN